MASFSPLVVGVEGLVLNKDEAAFLSDIRPYGVVLFKRNIGDKAQIAELISHIKDVVPGTKVVVDQEGGRVQRIDFDGRLPSAQEWGKAWVEGDKNAGITWGKAIGGSVKPYGFDWVFAPCLDRAVEGADAIIGSRAIAGDAETITAVADGFIKGLETTGILGCLKHAPGHGRAMVDSHHGLPVVMGTRAEMEEDIKPFKALAKKVPYIMTAHIAYPEQFGDVPATLNPELLAYMREDWGFKGKILADDMGMAALPGTYEERVVNSLAAGCNLAICSFSLIKKGMAGSFYDAEAAAALRKVAGKLKPL